METYIPVVLTLVLVNGIASQVVIPDIPDLDLADINIAAVLEILDKEKICTWVENTEKNDTCFKQLKIVCADDKFYETMMDAASKFPYSGALVRTRYDFGTYDECIDLDITVNGTRVLGKHCTGGLVIPVTSANDPDAFQKAFKLSTCIPNKCTAKYLLEIVNLSYVYPLFNDEICSTKKTSKQYTWDSYLVITCLSLLGLVMIAATIYDLNYYYTGRDCKHVAVQAFSMFHNGKKLFKTSKLASGEQIQVIHGLRVISMLWIVTAHTYVMIATYPSTDQSFTQNYEWTWNSFYATTGGLAVDTFFFISGLLLAYQYLKQKPQGFSSHVRKVPFMILHRYLRLTPVAAATYIIAITISKHLGNGPLFSYLLEDQRSICLKYWWSYFAYVQNYVNYNEMCIEISWYLSADWQLFLVSPLILIPVAMLVKNNFKWVMGQLLLLNVLFTLVPMAIKFAIKDYDNEYQSHTRLNDYFMGFMLGVHMREKRALKHTITNRMVVFLWGVAISILIAVTLIQKSIQLSIHFDDNISLNAYFGLLRAVWCVAIAWIIYACHHGYGGGINWILTTPVTQVLSKLTYSIYMLHGLVIFYFKSTSRLPSEASLKTCFEDTIVVYMVTVVLSVFYTLAFESPMIILEKHFMGKKQQNT